jgi:hypothetical protein
LTYRLGIDLGNAQTTWAVMAGRPDAVADSGTVNSVVTIVQTDDVHLVRDFVHRLGEPDPVIIGGTPNGAESLLARLIGSILTTVRQRQGEEPAAVVLAHDDGMDPYRSGLYAEAGRLAGVPSGWRWTPRDCPARRLRRRSSSSTESGDQLGSMP